MNSRTLVNERDLDTGERVWAPLAADKDLLTTRANVRAGLYVNTAGGGRVLPGSSTPLLLIHSANAAASAIEMLPIFERQARRRPVVAIDLPGFGAADRPDIGYSPEMMQEAIAAAIAWTQAHIAPGPVDLMALSVGCEFAAQAVLRNPQAVRTLSLISPTGMEEERVDEHYEGGRTRALHAVRVVLRSPTVGKALFAALTTRASMRWFLSRTWGGGGFDPRLLEQGLLTAQVPGARHAPLDFVAGALFTRGIIERYRQLPVPVWVAHGQHGAFNDFSACPTRTGGGLALASHRVVRTPFDTGALPHFAQADAFEGAFENFLAAATQGQRTWYAEPRPVIRHDARRPVAVRAGA
jgi:pimeloyl-ACP methyl ester carboxylesterase